jgi:hypothetical protein
MAEERFDLSYKGDLAPGSRSRAGARAPDGALQAQRGRCRAPVHRSAGDRQAQRGCRDHGTLYRGLRASRRPPDGDAAGHEAPSGNAPETAPGSHRNPPPRPESSDDSGADAPPLSLATTRDDFLEPTRTVNIAAFDTGELSLVSGQDWSLADCEPPPTPIPIPDIGYLSLAEMEPPAERPGLEHMRSETPWSDTQEPPD